MTKENGQVSADKTEKNEKPGIRIVQVLAAALAAVTAALLGSTIGVAGTVLGAGLASVITTVGGELYLRSLQRTRDAAARAREVLAATGGRRIRAQQDLVPQDRTAADQTVLLPVNPADQPTVQLPRPETGPADDGPSRLRKLRWPLIIGTSVVAFVVAVLAITGIESASGGKLGGNGNGGTTFFGGGGHRTEQPKDTPSTTVDTPTSTPTPDSTPTTTPTSPSTSETTPPPTTDSSPPSTTPKTTTPPPTTPSAPKLTPTPTP